MARFRQSDLEKAMRAAGKGAATLPSTVECHPDGRIILCFGQTLTSAEDALDREMAQWRSKHATG